MYAQLVDRLDRRELPEILGYADLYTRTRRLIDEAHVEGVLKGHDAIRTRMANASARMATAATGAPRRQSADLLSNVYVQVDGETATARSRFTFLAEDEDGSFRVRGSGLYLDTWVREDGAWKIKRRTVQWDLLAGQSARTVGAGGATN